MSDMAALTIGMQLSFLLGLGLGWVLWKAFKE